MRARFGSRSGRNKFGVRDVTSVANEVRQILWPDGDDAISAIDAVHEGYSKQGLSLSLSLLDYETDLLCSYYDAACNRQRSLLLGIEQLYKDSEAEILLQSKKT